MFLVVATLGLWASACNQLGNSPSDTPLGDVDGGPPRVSGIGPVCGTAAEGCPCTEDGSQAECGQVERYSGSYVSCSAGLSTCNGGKWSACVGDHVYTRSLVGDQGLQPAAFGTVSPCVGNPCDPSCQSVTDTPSGLVVSDGGFNTDGGLQPNPVFQSDAGVKCTGLSVTPAAQTVTVTALTPLTTSPATPTFAAAFTPSSCYATAAPAAWSLDKQDRAAISAGQLSVVSAIAGPITATGFVGTFSGTGVANVVVNVTDTSNAPSTLLPLFFLPALLPDLAMSPLYPYPNTYFPRGIAAPVVQWSAGLLPAALVKVSLRYPATGTPTFNVSYLTTESNPPRFQIGQDAWAALDATAAGGDAVIAIQRAFGVPGLAGASVLQEQTIPIHFGTKPLRGNIFYTEYDVNANTGTLKRAKANGTVASVAAYGSSGGCAVCHSVSADGSKLVTSNWGNSMTSVGTVNADGTLNRVADMGNNPLGSDSRAFAFSAVSPDGSLALQGTNFWGNTNASAQSAFAPHNNGIGLTGTYYTTTSLTGLACTQTDAAVAFSWGTASPCSGIGSNKTWSASWNGTLAPIYNETYTFAATATDGVRVYVNGVAVINQWGVTSATAKTYTGTAVLVAGTRPTIRVDYQNVSKAAQVKLAWQSATQPAQTIPLTQLYPITVPTAARGLLGSYYPSRDFNGAPAYQRVDATVNYGGGAPIAGIASTNFAVEWTGRLTAPCSGTWNVCSSTDDGGRLWVNNQKMSDVWYDQGQTTACGTVSLTAGVPVDVKMDYYQNGGGAVAQLLWGGSSCQSSQVVIPNAYLTPSGDAGMGGYDMPIRTIGDQQTYDPYKIFRLSNVAGTAPVDVSATTANAWGLGTVGMLVPSFSPDGTRMVFVDGDTSGGASWRQGLSFWNFNQTAAQFSGRTNFVNAVAAGNVVRWPTFETDSRSVVFQTNPTSVDDTGYGGMGPSGYGAIQGTLWSVDATNPGASPPVALAKLNAGNGTDSNRSYQPTMLPISAGGYRWLVFTSDRAYGNTLNQSARNTTQLWVSALDDTPSASTDRSHAPFWLPNQITGTDTARIRNERGYWVLDQCKQPLTTTAAPTPVAPPTPTWANADLGVGLLAGSATIAGGTFTVQASGADLWNLADSGNFEYYAVTGDATITARVGQIAYTDQWAKGGVMIRDSLAATASAASMIVSAAGVSQYQFRTNSTTGTSASGVLTGGVPYWVRLVRVGSVITGYASPDGATWTLTGSANYPSMGSTAYFGLATTSHNILVKTTAVYDNVSFAVPQPNDPRPASVCLDDSDCCGAPTSAVCRVDTPITSPPLRHCVVPTSTACASTGSTCSSDTDCCGFPSARCTVGKCTPPPSATYYPEITTNRDYQSNCAAGTATTWRFFDWQGTTPSDSKVLFTVQVASTQAGLATARSVTLGTASGAPQTSWAGIDVSSVLGAAGIPEQPFLRVTMDFVPSSDHQFAPTLTQWRQAFDCAASE